MAEQYTYSTWLFDQQVVYRAVQDGPGRWAATREVLGGRGTLCWVTTTH
jgi:hypothetical protein